MNQVLQTAPKIAIAALEADDITLTARMAAGPTRCWADSEGRTNAEAGPDGGRAGRLKSWTRSEPDRIGGRAYAADRAPAPR
jgi:hypothetical protein